MKAVIYSTPTCGQCVMAKNLLKSKDIPYEEYTVGKDVEKSVIEEKIGAPIRSVPQIFMNDEYVGGYKELMAKVA